MRGLLLALLSFDGIGLLTDRSAARTRMPKTAAKTTLTSTKTV